MPTPSGRQVVLVHGDQRAVVVEVGGGLRTYDIGGTAILDGYPEVEMCAGGRGQPLLPWPNRLADGRYRWRGREFQVALSEPAGGTAIHGLTRWLRWDVADATTASATMVHRLAAHPGYPWTLDASITYRLDDAGLSVATTVVNRSREPAPFGIGFHPYLAAFDGTVDGCTLTVPAGEVYDLDARGLPTGRRTVEGTGDDYRLGAVIGDRRLDVPFTDLTRDSAGRAWITLRAPTGSTRRLWMDGAFTHVQAFSGDTLAEVGRRRRGLAVEPMTGPADLLATGDGLRTLEPGDPFSATWGVASG